MLPSWILCAFNPRRTIYCRCIWWSVCNTNKQRQQKGARSRLRPLTNPAALSLMLIKGQNNFTDPKNTLSFRSRMCVQRIRSVRIYCAVNLDLLKETDALDQRCSSSRSPESTLEEGLAPSQRRCWSLYSAWGIHTEEACVYVGTCMCRCKTTHTRRHSHRLKLL